MHRRYENINIPIEIIRTVVAIAEHGSYSKAGKALGLSQPAITAQMKRLQVVVGGLVFERTAGGIALTERGKLILLHARKMLEANDQILLLGGARGEATALRLGLSSLYASEFFRIWPTINWPADLAIFCGHSAELERSLSEGYLDIACLLMPPDKAMASVGDWYENFVWARSRRFVVSPGTPIPIITSPGGLQDQPAIQALQQNGLTYRVVMTSFDYGARLAAAAADLGLVVMPERHVTEPLIIAKDYYLPQLAPVHVGIRVRHGVPTSQVENIVDMVMKLAPPQVQQSAA